MFNVGRCRDGRRGVSELTRFEAERASVRGNSSDPVQGFRGFTKLVSNVAAVRLATDFAEGRVGLGLIDGVPGWGKTHLLTAAAASLQSTRGSRVHVISALDLPTASVAQVTAPFLIIDDLHLAEGRPRAKQRLSFEIERRGRLGRPTLCASSSSETRGALRKNWRTERVSEPTDEERVLVLKGLCERESVRVTARQVELICSLVKGDGATLRGVVQRLKLVGQELPQLHSLRLAGVIDPYVKGWGVDLCDVILDAASVSLKPRGQDSTTNSDCLAVYLMRAHACLPEARVAAYFGLSAVQVHTLQKQAENLVRIQNGSFVAAVQRSLDAVDSRFRS